MPRKPRCDAITRLRAKRQDPLQDRRGLGTQIHWQNEPTLPAGLLVAVDRIGRGRDCNFDFSSQKNELLCVDQRVG